MIQGIMEGIFDLAYFITALTIGIILLKNGKSKYVKLFGIMAIVLACGDAFHLVPRVYSLMSNGKQGLIDNVFALGLGKLITSITMTIFYVILYFIVEIRINKKSKMLRGIIIGLGLIRIILCAFPQNEWFIVEPSLAWSIIRNVPFAIMGIIIIVLCFIQYRERNDKQYLLMAIMVILSFAFYIPVIFVSSLGFLMIPKTLAYVGIVLIGYKGYKEEIKADQISKEI